MLLGEQREKGGLANSHPAKAKHLWREGNPMPKRHRGGACGGILVSLLQLPLKKAEETDGRMAVTGTVLSQIPPLSRSGERQGPPSRSFPE